MFILVYLKKINVVVLINHHDQKIWIVEISFQVTYVQSPQQGRHEWVFDLDITSMYPSVIRSLNISPETKIGTVVGWDDLKNT